VWVELVFDGVLECLGIPFLFYFSCIHHPTLSKPKKRKRKLVSSPRPSPKKEKKRDLFPLTTLHKSKKWTCTQPLTLPKKKNKNRLNTTSTPPFSPNKKIKISFCTNFLCKTLVSFLIMFHIMHLRPCFKSCPHLKQFYR